MKFYQTKNMIVLLSFWEKIGRRLPTPSRVGSGATGGWFKGGLVKDHHLHFFVHPSFKVTLKQTTQTESEKYFFVRGCSRLQRKRKSLGGTYFVAHIDQFCNQCSGEQLVQNQMLEQLFSLVREREKDMDLLFSFVLFRFS